MYGWGHRVEPVPAEPVCPAAARAATTEPSTLASLCLPHALGEDAPISNSENEFFIHHPSHLKCSTYILNLSELFLLYFLSLHSWFPFPCVPCDVASFHHEVSTYVWGL